MANEWVNMRHPDVHVDDSIESSTVTREAFDEVWAAKGWELEEEHVPAPIGSSVPINPLNPGDLD